MMLKELFYSGQFSKIISKIDSNVETFDEFWILIESFLAVGNLSKVNELIEKADSSILDPFQRANLYLIKAKTFLELGEIKNSLESILEGKKLFNYDENIFLEFVFDVLLSKIFFWLGELDKAEGLIDELQEELDKKDFEYKDKFQADLDFIRGNISYEDADYQQARINYEKSLKTRKKYDNKKEIADVLHNLALLLFEEHKFKDSLKLNHEALTLRKELGNPGMIGISLNNIANIHHDNRARSLSNRLHQEALEYVKQGKNQLDFALVTHNLGTYQRKGEIDINKVKIFMNMRAKEHILLSKLC